MRNCTKRLRPMRPRSLPTTCHWINPGGTGASMKAIMAAKYLIRFDDICPTMNWDIWKKIEQILIHQKVDPILAVVPDNKDKNLMVGEAELRFWDVVRSWQARGWAIGIHGYQHTYVTDQAGLVGLNNRSEFAGLDEHEQESKLIKALNLFQTGRDHSRGLDRAWTFFRCHNASRSEKIENRRGQRWVLSFAEHRFSWDHPHTATALET